MAKSLIALSLVCLALLPAVALAAGAEDGFFAQLKPDCKPASGELNVDGAGCGLDDFMVLLRNVAEFLVQTIVPITAAIMLIWGGFVILTSGGSPERVKQGRRIIYWALVGVAIAFSVWLIIKTIYLLLGVSDSTLLPQ